MNKLLLLFSFLLVTSIVLSQEVERSEVSGKVIVKDNDIEGVTVYNATAKKGTITDFDGNFKIEAGLNDRIEVSALQFKKFVITIDERIIEQKKMTIFLIEVVNKLPEVIVSPYDLSGNIAVDAERVRALNLPFEMDIGDAPIDLTNDNKTRAENPFVMGARRNPEGFDVKNLIGVLLKPLFKKKTTDISTGSTQDQELLNLRLMYTNEYINTVFGVPKNKVNEFIVFVEDQGIDNKLLKEGNEMEFINFLVIQSKSFLDAKGGKN